METNTVYTIPCSVQVSLLHQPTDAITLQVGGDRVSIPPPIGVYADVYNVPVVGYKMSLRFSIPPQVGVYPVKSASYPHR